jgi:hypothetical protein
VLDIIVYRGERRIRNSLESEHLEDEEEYGIIFLEDT